MRVAFRVLGFSTSGGAPAMICRARLAANTTYANWLSGAFVSTFISVIPPKRCQKLFHPLAAPPALAAQRHNNGLRFASRALYILIHDTIIVIFTESCNLIPGPSQAARDLIVGILPAAAQPSFQLLGRRRQDKNGHRLRELFFYLRRALNVDLQDKIEP